MDDKARNLLFGLGGGVLLAAALPLLAPVVAEVTRPVAKALLKQGLLGFDRLRTYVARASESLEDMIAEARAEVAHELEELGDAPVDEVPVPGRERPGPHPSA